VIVSRCLFNGKKYRRIRQSQQAVFFARLLHRFLPSDPAPARAPFLPTRTVGS
jgi:hypothetical protein